MTTITHARPESSHPVRVLVAVAVVMVAIAIALFAALDSGTSSAPARISVEQSSTNPVGSPDALERQALTTQNDPNRYGSPDAAERQLGG
jgi:hypothetical protein